MIIIILAALKKKNCVTSLDALILLLSSSLFWDLFHRSGDCEACAETRKKPKITFFFCSKYNFLINWFYFYKTKGENMSQRKKETYYEKSLMFDKYRSVTMFLYHFGCKFNSTIKDSFCNARESTWQMNGHHFFFFARLYGTHIKKIAFSKLQLSNSFSLGCQNASK